MDFMEHYIFLEYSWSWNSKLCWSHSDTN